MCGLGVKLYSYLLTYANPLLSIFAARVDSIQVIVPSLKPVPDPKFMIITKKCLLADISHVCVASWLGI